MRVSALYVHPVKALAADAVQQVVVRTAGFVGDRRFVLVDQARRFVTQREHPLLALVSAKMTSGGLRLHAPSGAELVVASEPSGAREDVRVWDDVVSAVIAREAEAWLERELGLPLSLAFMHDGDRMREGGAVSFADGYPFLLASQSSLDDLSARAKTQFAMTRFRPNIVVSGAPAWDEDRWREIRIGDVTFAAAKPCERCVVTTVDPATGEKGREPLATLASFRKRGQNVLFGINMMLASESTDAEIHVGDPVEVRS